MKYWSVCLITGPMFSGKTTELIRLIERERIAKMNCMIIKHKNDIRYDNEYITNHESIQYKKCDIIHVEILDENLVNKIKEKKINVVGIDEGQFFEGLHKFVCKLIKNNVRVIISGLNGSYKQEPFAEISNVIPHCDNIICLHAVCMECHCQDAAFTVRISNDTELVSIGGVDKYKSVCRNCLNDKFNK